MDILEGQFRKHYSNWEKETGKITLVKLIEFEKYVRYNEAIYTFIENEIKYEGQIWKCKDFTTDKIKYLKFRVEHLPIPYGETTLEYNHITQIADYIPNTITDSLEECTLGIVNKDLFPRLDLRKDYIKACKKVNNEVSQIRIKLITDIENIQVHWKEYNEFDKELRTMTNQEINEILHW